MSALATRRPITPRSQAASAASCRRAATRWCSTGAAATPSWPTRSRKRAGLCCSIDLIVVNSVVQYLSASQFSDALKLFCRLLKSDGKLLIGDIIAPDTPLVGHVTTFLRFAWRNGFFVAAIIGLARNFVSPYRKLRRDAGYACYTPTQMLGLLDDNGFVGERLTSNIAVSQLRSSYLARKPSAGGVSSGDKSVQ
jgi:hypothetical protein